MSADAAHTARRLGFVGWSAEAAAMLDVLREGAPEAARAAVVLGGGEQRPEALRPVPTVEALFEAATHVFVAGGPSLLAPYLPMMRLAITDRHVLTLLGSGWRMDDVLAHLHERKVVRTVLLASSPGRAAVAAYYAAPHLDPADRETYRQLFAHLELTLPLNAEAHVEVLQALAAFTPAAFATVLEAMADAMVMTGLGREPMLRVLATLLQGATGRMLEEGVSPATLREAALSQPVAASGLVELEAAGVRGALMRAVQQALRRAAETDAAGRPREP